MRASLLTLLMFALAAAVLLPGARGVDYDRAARQRLEYARLGQDEIVIAAIKEPWAESYLNGIRLAVEQLNNRKGRLLGRPVRLLVKSSDPTSGDAQGVALDLAQDPKVTAVLGHRRSETAIPASVIYEAAKLIYLPPFSTAKGLTSHDFKFTFRMVPNNTAMAEQIASVAEILGHKRVVLLYAQDDYSRELAFLFEDAAIDRGLSFVHRRSFNAQDSDYRELVTQFSNKSFDLVFLSAGTAAGGQMIQQLREMGVKTPVMGGEALNARSLAEAAGAAGDNTVVPVFYLAEAQSRANHAFVEAYRQAYGEAPDQNAAQGYDSVGLLAAAIEQAKSTVPTLIASTLHYMPFWTGVTGVHSFSSRGDVQGKKYFFQVLRDGAWHFLPAVHMPYFLDRFDRFARAQSGRQGPPPEFRRQFSTNLPADDLRILQLDFLHEILQFHKLGVIYSEQQPGRLPDKVARVVALGEKRGFAVQTCGVAQAGPAPLERRMLNCYGKLATAVEAINVTGFKGGDKDTVVRLQKPLKEYKIPVLALQGDTDFEEGMAIRVGRLADRRNIQTDFYLDLFSGLLYGTKVYELAEKVNNLPMLAVNLSVLNDYGLLRSGSLVGLAPDLYLEWVVSTQ